MPTLVRTPQDFQRVSGVKKINGDYIGKESMDKVGVGPKNVNLIPPRLRERLSRRRRLARRARRELAAGLAAEGRRSGRG